MPNPQIIQHEEKLKGKFEGSIIDIETIGDFEKKYKGDSREYMKLKQVIFGFINSDKLQILCARDTNSIRELAKATKDTISSLERPFFAFNCAFESCVWYHQIGIKIEFDGELQRYKFESKKSAIQSLDIPNYEDPFFDEGKKCLLAWECGDIDHAIAHNRACLLKERDILLKRGHRDSFMIDFIK